MYSDAPFCPDLNYDMFLFFTINAAFVSACFGAFRDITSGGLTWAHQPDIVSLSG